MKTLNDIAIELGQVNTNHFTGTDKYSIHKYIQEFYEEEFSKYQDKRIRLLEIGTMTGASLLIWRRYFPLAEIYGIDIQDQRIPRYIHPDIVYLFCNAYDPTNLEKLSGFDIIIDDGPHSLDSRLKFIEIYFDRLNAGGLFIIEDIEFDSDLQLCIDRLQAKTSNKIGVLDNRSKSNFNNSRILFVRK